MESKLLYDLYVCSLVRREEIIKFVQQKLSTHKEEIDYYDVIYSENIENKEFLSKLSLICNNILLGGELKKKYIAIITLFYKKQSNVNIEESLYNFFLDKDRELLDIDFDFWNFVSTDWELKKDGFSGISNSKKIIEEYLNNKSGLETLSESEILNIISVL
ncbi:hypothetical protein [Chryseobacterium sp. G0201]|uniref:hypothetical protein n=1 Tax=Chryseobacterium sp. G0201 TaxID=2487065 RepID=UPI000F4FD48C|nr:hypothetical protein [Chryseobacterium sp. G0201]AZA52500.1 hypothetical protein EG348_05535 [Chryseobacterium sp. G0201]